MAQELEELLPGRVTTDVAAYLKDWWPLQWLTDEPIGSATAAVRPGNVAELVRLADFASARGVPLYVRGGGSSVTGASIPSGGVVVDTASLDQILDLDETNRTVTVQAGVKLSALESKLNEKRLTLSQFPQSFELATVGGFVSTLGTGQYSTLYGGIEDSVLRLEVVLPTGEVIWTRKRGAPRSSVGPDLSRLFLGAEGAFGIVSAAELKVRRLPGHVWKAAFSFPDFAAAVNAARGLLELDVRPAVCRAYNELESQFQFDEKKSALLLVYHFRSEGVLKAVRGEVAALLEEGSTPADPGLVDAWLEKRFNFREQMDSMKKLGYAVETMEVAARWSRLLELYYEAVDALGGVPGVGGVGAHVSHLYDQGACLYFTVLFQPKEETYRIMWDRMAKVAKSHDATISHHHGVGMLKMVYAKDEVPLQVLARIKQAVDPNRTMSPGRLYGGGAGARPAQTS
ncbi:MAG: FAD-binding oxidoreductase [Nitrososphaerota archaeon]|nr:FAD-binding oxidoreductase [Nitrososphaerota archaeon]MDG7003260.1 FAD-binding oxidoreductase [Nitrososphaerota archaeon]MDG7034078.1 FAD-binding oxidoreductase [Nitrososphaerota archaeon]